MALLPSDPKKQKLVLLAMLPLLGAVAYWYMLHGTYAEENERLRQRFETISARNDVARVQAMRAGSDLEERLRQYQRHMVRLERLIPTSAEVPELLNDMTLRAQETGVELALLQPQAEIPGPFYNQQIYEIGVLGAYHDVGRFLTAVGSLPRIITSTDLRLGARGDTTRTGATRLEAILRIQTYILPAPPAMEVNADARS